MWFKLCVFKLSPVLTDFLPFFPSPSSPRFSSSSHALPCPPPSQSYARTATIPFSLCLCLPSIVLSRSFICFHRMKETILHLLPLMTPYAPSLSVKNWVFGFPFGFLQFESQARKERANWSWARCLLEMIHETPKVTLLLMNTVLLFL